MAAPKGGAMAAVTKPRVETTRPSELVRLALDGVIRIPPFQRSFRWEKDDVLKLFDSIFRGYPIGNLLMWRRPAEAGRIEIGPLAIEVAERPNALWVVDGQQRITSLVGALAAPSDTVDPKFRIYFDLRTQKFTSAGRRDRVPEHWLPMPIVLHNERLLRWLRDRRSLSDDEVRFCDSVVTQIREYEIPMSVVEGDDQQALGEMFERLNTSGKRLTRFEVFEALNTISNQMQPSGLQALASRVRGFGFGELSRQMLILSVLTISGSKADDNVRLELFDAADRRQVYMKTEQALGNVVEFLRDDVRIPHIRLLPYALFVPVLARFAALFGPPQGRAADLLRRWVWRGSVVGVAPQGNTVGVRRNAVAIHDDPVASADRLLRLLPAGGEHWAPDLTQIRLTSAQGKLNVLALCTLEPRMLDTGAPVDLVGILEEGTSPLVPIWPSKTTLIDPANAWLLSSLANRIIYPRSIQPAALHGDPAALASHCIDDDWIERMGAEGQGSEGFLRYRADRLRTSIASIVQRHALFGFRDGPDIRALFDDGGDSSAA
jgi:hypothetical protein